MDAIKNKNATLIDLRNQDELDEYGFIENAVHIPLPEIPTKVDEIKSYSKPIVLFCKAGVRAEKAKEFLEDQLVFIRSEEISTPLMLRKA